MAACYTGGTCNSAPAAADIEETPDFGDGTATSFLLGMAKVNGKVEILLNIDQILTRQELDALGALVDE
jgi:purine-binding chemotaxis protein CheW